MRLAVDEHTDRALRRVVGGLVDVAMKGIYRAFGIAGIDVASDMAGEWAARKRIEIEAEERAVMEEADAEEVRKRRVACGMGSGILPWEKWSSSDE